MVLDTALTDMALADSAKNRGLHQFKTGFKVVFHLYDLELILHVLYKDTDLANMFGHTTLWKQTTLPFGKWLNLFTAREGVNIT